MAEEYDSNGGSVPELGAMGTEIMSLMAMRVPKPKKRKSKKYVIEDVSQNPAEKAFHEMVAKMFFKRINKLEAKIERGGKKKRKGPKKDPSPKQRAQWDVFTSRVGDARRIYLSQSERSAKAWQAAMQKAKSTENTKSFGEDIQLSSGSIGDIMVQG